MLSKAVLAAASLSRQANRLDSSYGMLAAHEDLDRGSLKANIELLPPALLAENLSVAHCWPKSSQLVLGGQSAGDLTGQAICA